MNENDIIHCQNCGHDILIYKGKTFFGGTWFDCYVCEKCKNKILLQCINEQNVPFYGNLERNVKKLT